MRRRTWIIALLTMIATAASAHADGVNFAWQNCYPEGGTVNRTSTCTAGLGTAGIAVGSFLLAQGIDIVGFEATVLVQIEGSAIPPWWQFFNAGSCRQIALTAGTAFASYPNQQCHDPWNGQAVSGIAAYAVAPGGVPNLARITAVGSVATPLPIPGQQEYSAFDLRISNALTATCSGCATPATLTLQNLRIDASVGGGFVFHHLNTPLQNQCITWQNAQNICATAVAPNRSWGQIKTLYR